MKRKDYYIGLLCIMISLHFLGFITSPHNFGDFRTYLYQDSVLTATFGLEVFLLSCLLLSEIIPWLIKMVKDANK